MADLDAATLGDVREFSERYYAPGNAVLVVAGDFDRKQTRGWIERYFGPVPARATPPRPDVSEPRQQAGKRHTLTDPLAPRPGLALAWHVPPRGTPEHYAFGLLDQILLQGEDSRLWQRLVRERGFAGEVAGGVNLLGNLFDYDGPMLWMVYLVHDDPAAADAILADLDAEIARAQREPPPAAELERALTKLRAGLYDLAGSNTRFGLSNLLAAFALFDDDPARINRLEEQFRAVTPELIRQVAADWLRPENRTILTLAPGRVAGKP